MADEKYNNNSTEKSSHGAVSPVLTVTGTGNAVVQLTVSTIFKSISEITDDDNFTSWFPCRWNNSEKPRGGQGESSL